MSFSALVRSISIGILCNCFHRSLFPSSLLVRTCSSSNSKDQNMNIILKDRSGIIKTPGYPSNFPTNLITQCYWKILAPKNHVVRLDFISFRMGSSHCVYIHDSINKENPVETFKCRSKTSFTFYASGREASLSVYRIPYADGTSGPGFIANYSVTPLGERARLYLRYLGQPFLFPIKFSCTVILRELL